MRLLLLRHALPERVDVVSEAPDPPLSEIGVRQAAAAAQVLALERIDAVWSSPLLRARQTAEPLAEPRGLPVRIHPGVAEFDFGDGLYIPAEETTHPSIVAMTRFMADQDGNPELQEFQRTVVAAIEEIAAETPDDATVAIACHGGVVNAYASSVLGTRQIFFGKMSYAGVSWFNRSRSGHVRVVALNEHAHVRALGDQGR